MKHFLTLLLLILPLFAYSQTLSVASFSLDLKDQTANNEATKKLDENGEVCALIRVETTQKGFVFDGGTLGVVAVDDSKVGEIWVFVPAGLSHITIRHPQLGTLRDYYFPERLQSARTYVMKLITGSVETVVKQEVNQQWFILTYEPKEAMVEIDGTIVEGDNGQLKKRLEFGKHDLRVSAKNYHTEVAKFEIGSERNSMILTLKPAFGWVEIKGPKGASVFIDNEKIGEAPMKSNPIASGQHDLNIVKENWFPHREQIIVNDNTVTTVDPKLMANFATVTLTTENGAEIWVDDEKKGKGTVTIDLQPGEHKFESRKDKHRAQSIARSITLESAGTIDIPAPIAIVGSLSIDANPIGAKIYLDGKLVGESPLLLNNVLIGHHDIKLSFEGMMDEDHSVEIAEGKISEMNLTMNRRTTILLNNNWPGIEILNDTLKKVPKDFKGKFIIGDDITVIGDWAFTYCDNLTGVTIPYRVTSIGEYAFNGCAKLTEINIPNSVINVGYGAFFECNSIAKPLYNNSIFFWLPVNFEGSYTVPSGIKVIANNAFYDCINLTDITLPNSVRNIETRAFSGCVNLTKVTLPNNLTTIEGGLFSGCKNLRSITIPNSVVSIGSEAFVGCESLTDIIIPNSVKRIGFASFAWCSSLNSIEIPVGVTIIIEKTFKDCINLTRITLPNSIDTIDNQAFVGCKNLKYLNFPNSIKYLGFFAFDGCPNIVDVLYNNTIFAYMPNSYEGSYSIPYGISTIAEGAFSGCTGLTDIVIPNSVKCINDFAFFGCEKLKSVEIPNSVDSIGASTFWDCKSLTNIVLPNGIKSIAENLFCYCENLKSIIIPSSVTTIDRFSFEGCKNLSSVTIPNSVTTIGWSAFDYCNPLIYVEYGTKEKFKGLLPEKLWDRIIER